jgi:di/tricarboxylate transporter
MTYLDPRKTIWPGLITSVVLAWWLQSAGQPSAITITAVVAWLCMAWWIFEPIPIPVTSLLPMAVFPVTGVLTAEQVGASVGIAADYPADGWFSPVPRAWRVRGRITGWR